MILLGLSGKKQSGKDTCANLIQQLVSHTFNFYRLGFADALYREVAIMLLKNEGYHPTDSLISEKIRLIHLDKPRYRGLLQWYGTEYRRTSNERYWIDKWLERTLSISDNHKNKPLFLVCTDVRFPNEYDCIEKCGGLVYRVNRTSSLPNVDEHLSETALDGHHFDYTIQNDFSLEELKQHLRVVLQFTISQHNKNYAQRNKNISAPSTAASDIQTSRQQNPS